MTNRPSPKGWIVRATTKRVRSGHPSVAIYDVTIPDAAEALEAVRRVCGPGPDTIVETIGELPSATDLRDGEVLQR
jgi:hypothetical protein